MTPERLVTLEYEGFCEPLMDMDFLGRPWEAAERLRKDLKTSSVLKTNSGKVCSRNR
jgi:hypothetical protein